MIKGVPNDCFGRVNSESEGMRKGTRYLIECVIYAAYNREREGKMNHHVRVN